MTYSLIYRAGGAENRIHDPTPEEIEQAIDIMIPVLNYYLILQEDECEKCGHRFASFVQMLIGREDSPKHIYYIEFHESPLDELLQCNHSKENRKVYSHSTTNEDETKRIFRMFALGVNPLLDNWNDVTERVFKKNRG